MAAIQPNHRASLLAGLRTGGVRSASGPQVPHTAAPNATFQFPRMASSQVYNNGSINEEMDELADMVSQTSFVNGSRSFPRQVPRTASATVSSNMFQQQQQDIFQRQLATQSALVNGGYGGLGGLNNASDIQAQNLQQLQLQMMQVEMLRLQALQFQAAQADAVLQAQRQQQQQQQQQQTHRRMSGVPEPFTAGPSTTSFSNAVNPIAQLRARQVEQLQAQQDLESVELPPMTAALDGRFGSRVPSNGLNPNANVFVGGRFGHPGDQATLLGAMPPNNTPATASYTNVISGGAALGSTTLAPSKSDSAVSWRRSSNSVLSGSNARSASISPPVHVTPPSDTETTQPNVVNGKIRPQPLRFSMSVQPPVPVLAIDLADGSSDDSSEQASSSPTTPASTNSQSSLSAREEATKRLYEGLGIGRPVSQTAVPVAAPTLATKATSLPTRQPRGPPASVDELGERNFANRLRKKAIGGLGVLMGARERRDSALHIEVTAY